MATSILRDRQVAFAIMLLQHCRNHGTATIAVDVEKQAVHTSIFRMRRQEDEAFSSYSCLEDLESCLEVNLVKPTGIITAKISQKSNTGSNNEATMGTTNASPTLPIMLKLCLGIEQRMGYRASVICSQTIVWLFVLPSRLWEA
jgi:hypothetical protein